MSAVTGIEFLSKTRSTYSDELSSFANKGLKLNKAEDGIKSLFYFNLFKSIHV